MLVKQRDNEIGILLNYLNKQKESGGDTGVPVQGAEPGKAMNGSSLNGQTNTTTGSSYINSTALEYGDNQEEKKEPASQGTLFQMMQGGAKNNNKSISEKRMDFELSQQAAKLNAINSSSGFDQQLKEAQSLVSEPIQCSLEDLADRAKSFEMFRKSYRKNEAMEENRALLKEKYGRGKQLGMSVNATRTQIKDLTNQIEQIRKQNALRGMVDDNGEIVRTDEEEALQLQINKLKQTYQKEYNELKDLKTEIERIQNLLEKCRVRMQKDFEQWLTVMIKH